MDVYAVLTGVSWLFGFGMGIWLGAESVRKSVEKVWDGSDRRKSPKSPGSADPEIPICVTCGKGFETTGTGCEYCKSPLHTECFRQDWWIDVF